MTEADMNKMAEEYAAARVPKVQSYGTEAEEAKTLADALWAKMDRPTRERAEIAYFAAMGSRR